MFMFGFLEIPLLKNINLGKEIPLNKRATYS